MRFSVCMCVYNGDNAAYFEEALESIKNQTVIPDEIVLVVDGPINDELQNVINKFKFNDFKVDYLDENYGHGVARRKSIDLASYELIALMDADDISVPNRFEQQISVFREMEVDVVGGLISEFMISPKESLGVRMVPENNKTIKECLGFKSPLNQVTVMMKKPKYYEAGGYLDWHYNEDYYLWIRMDQVNSKFYNIQKTLVNVRVGNDMYKRRGGLKYFRSEAGIQKLLLSKKYISFFKFIKNVAIRFVLQVVMTSKMRAIVFKKFARK